jgi:hypothetical protein
VVLPTSTHVFTEIYNNAHYTQARLSVPAAFPEHGRTADRQGVKIGGKRFPLLAKEEKRLELNS